MAAQLNGRPRASIADVAARAGVSVGTVSNVLNRPERVSDHTRARVEAAVQDLAFVRNGSARQLRQGVPSVVGAIVLDIANPFFTAAARGVEDRLSRDSHTLMLGSSDEDPMRQARLLQQFEEHGVRGMLITPPDETMTAIEQLRERGTPVVLLDRLSDHPDISSVSVDNVHGATLAVRHLLELGHEHIAFLNGHTSIRQCADRREGARQAMAEAGADPDSLVELTLSSLSSEGGSAAMSTVLEEHSEVTATFCINDIVALGALWSLRERKIEVPGGMALVGYDDVSFAPVLAPPLTSVRQPAREMGFRAADLLLSGGPAQQVVRRPELVIRTSSAG